MYNSKMILKTGVTAMLAKLFTSLLTIVLLQLPLHASGEQVSNDLAATHAPLQVASLRMSPGLIQPAETDSSSKGGGLSNLAKDLGISGLGSNEPLHPDEAFKYFVNHEGGQITAFWKVTPGHYLYQEKIRFESTNPDFKIGTPVLPKAKLKQDEYLGNTNVYEQDFTVIIPILNAAKGDFELTTHYQGCSEITGICYAPQKNKTTLTFTKAVTGTDTVSAADKAKVDAQASADTQTATTSQSEQDALFDRIKKGSLIGIAALFILLGLGLALTPCVFPMIPILSGIIAGQGQNISTGKAFMLSLAYVLPMAITYAIVGVIAGLSGANLQIMFQNPWVISSFAVLFVLLAFAMFGFYELQMPSSIQSKLNELSNQQQSGSYIGAAIMGVLSALIVGPCVTAPLIAALTYIAQTGDAVIGGVALFALGIGMGIPLIIIGTSAGKLLPKAGAWMNVTKAAFGVMMLALAIWMLERILPFEIIMLLSGILLVVTGVYMKAINTLPENASGWSYLWKGIGLVFLLYGIFLLIGYASGNKSMISPLKGLAGGSGVVHEEQHLQFERFKSLDDLNNILATAKKNQQTVMLDFYADWCVSCKEMEHTTFKNPDVVDALKHTLLLQADVTANDKLDKELLEHFELFGPPGIFFYDRQGVEHKPYRLVGYVGPEKFLKHVNEFLNI